MLSCTTVPITGRERINLVSERADAKKVPPEFLSTHPSNQSIIKGLNDYIPTAMAYAKKVNDQVGIQEEQQQNTH